jgi:hypothetical protein
MYFQTFLTFALAAGTASSAAVPNSLLGRTLNENDVIMWSKDGRIEVVNKTTFAALSAGQGYNLTAPTPTIIDTTTSNSPETNGTATLDARCSKETIFTMDPVSTFLNWDVPMSSVLKATGDTASVSVTQGYSITNTVSVGVSSSLTLVENFLSTSFSIDYSQSWSSSYSAAYTFTIPDGKYGVVVSNPLTTRHSGKVDIGCVGAAETTTFYGDSYTSKAYGGLSWVDGTISLCTGDSYPMPMCNGQGTLS